MTQSLTNVILKGDASQIKATSLKEPYKQMGELHLRQAATEAIEKNLKDEEEIGKSVGGTELTQWLFDTIMQKSEKMNKFGGFDMENVIKQAQKEAKAKAAKEEKEKKNVKPKKSKKNSGAEEEEEEVDLDKEL